jgi:hypothetical protein
MIVYLLFGLPLTQILLIDMGHMLMYSISVSSAFLQLLNKRSSLYADLREAFKHSSLTLMRIPSRNGNQQQSSKQDDRSRKINSAMETHFDMLYQIYLLAVEQANSNVKLGMADFSTSFILCFLGGFILLGSVFSTQRPFAFESASASAWLSAFIAQFYTNFNVFTQINVASSHVLYDESPFFKFKTIVYCIYTFLGVSFTFSALKVLRERLRVCLIDNCKRLLIALFKFGTDSSLTKNEPSEGRIAEKADSDEYLSKYLGGIGREERLDAAVLLASVSSREESELQEALSRIRRTTFIRSQLENEQLATRIGLGHKVTPTANKQTQVTTILCSRYQTNEDVELRELFFHPIDAEKEKLKQARQTETKATNTFVLRFEIDTQTEPEKFNHRDAYSQPGVLDKTSIKIPKDPPLVNTERRANLSMTVIKAPGGPSSITISNPSNTAERNAASLVRRRSRFET